MERLALALGLVAAAVAVAVVLSRRRPDGPTQLSWTVPTQLDRSDFPRPDAPWLVVVFTSLTCDTCAVVRQAASALASEAVVVYDAEVGADAALHARYAIDAVPTVVIADGGGLVVRDFVGPVRAAQLWAAMAEIRS